ncbi:MAG: transporter, CydDC cysteine exporter (CydDC-E) family, permease/ATP-binding protein CydC, partial [Frankiales bacterium]|nr:transporter, CydDC cysteine exporter (CydDC-E) family, permease/ATP-binding protein CydC [Frankiales bacterium]
GRLALALAASAAAGASALGLSAASGWLILRAAQHPGVQALAVAVVAVRASALTKAGSRYAERLSGHDLALRVLTRTRVRVLRALVPLAPTGLDLWRRGDVLRRFTADIDAVQDVVIRGVLPALGAVTTGLLGLLVIAPLAPSAVPVVGLLLVGTCGVLLLAAWGGSLGIQDATDLAGSRDQAAVAWVEGFRELWAYDALDTAAAHVREADARADRADRPARLSGAAAAGACSACAGLGPVLVLATAGGTADGLLVGVAALLAATSVEPLAALGPAWAALRGACLRAGRVAALLASPVPVPAPAVTVPAPSGPWGLEITDATLAHGQVAVLEALDLTVPSGSRVALVGPSGCGKSTLLAATLRLLQPAAGTVEVAGPDSSRSVSDLHPEQMPTLVAGCLQGDHVFDASLRENLRIGRPLAEDGDLDAVADRLGLLTWVRGLPDGWSTPAGPDGNRLSGGQRQRLLLARALLADPGVLVLDEPTAHLDPETERVVLSDLLAATVGRTVLLTTHRPAALDALSGGDTWHSLDPAVRTTAAGGAA